MNEDSKGNIFIDNVCVGHRFGELIEVYFPEVLEDLKIAYPDCWVEMGETHVEV